ncbi:hypothetical protein VMUT_1496 [Vulcanisaeta moutnovskia 768-28]|uniref:CRISPR system endoribonuclease Csx1 CARF domain-containing protein n=1 Tax=Vulcanisaeta moutnovskia (strain 768-28) TaxID=985053 RepID=F0QTI8_VULM7|nr:TM1812 family CRISPR-associated protein [Vulcanisaeta moutnovskia]ADY01701.1 hypothetical protein VMUT_1496 [Vulcanisaeta moutnovskia 768-28]
MTVLRKLRELGNVSEVIMDITHGLNYMPTMMLRYASLAVYTYVTTSSTEKLTVKVVDSEPYTPQLRDYDITLGIRDVSAENLGKAYSLYKTLSMPSINTVGTLNKTVRKSSLVALDALHNGTYTLLPLLPINEALDWLDKALDLNRALRVVIDGNEARRTVMISHAEARGIGREAWLETVVSMHSLLTIAAHIRNELTSDVEAKPPSDKYVVITSLRRLREVTNKYTYISGIRELVNTEINNAIGTVREVLDKGYAKQLTNKWIKYSKLKDFIQGNMTIKPPLEEQWDVMQGSDYRNVIAHAGLDKENTALQIDRDNPDPHNAKIAIHKELTDIVYRSINHKPS